MYGNLWYPGKSHRVIKHKYSQANSECTRWHFAFPLCCHSNDTRVPITNQPNSTQLGSTPTIPQRYIQVHAVVWKCGEGQTDTQTNRRPWPTYISLRLCFTRNVISDENVIQKWKCIDAVVVYVDRKMRTTPLHCAFCISSKGAHAFVCFCHHRGQPVLAGTSS